MLTPTYADEGGDRLGSHTGLAYSIRLVHGERIEAADANSGHVKRLRHGSGKSDPHAQAGERTGPHTAGHQRQVRRDDACTKQHRTHQPGKYLRMSTRIGMRSRPADSDIVDEADGCHCGRGIDSQYEHVATLGADDQVSDVRIGPAGANAADAGDAAGSLRLQRNV